MDGSSENLNLEGKLKTFFFDDNMLRKTCTER